MSYVKATCVALGATLGLLLLYSQRQTILSLLLARKKAPKRRGAVKAAKLDGTDGNYSMSYFEQGQPNGSPTLLLFHGFTSTKGT